MRPTNDSDKQGTREALEKKVKAIGKAGLRKRDVPLRLLKEADEHKGEDASTALQNVVSELITTAPKVPIVIQLDDYLFIRKKLTLTFVSSLLAMLVLGFSSSFSTGRWERMVILSITR